MLYTSTNNGFADPSANVPFIYAAISAGDGTDDIINTNVNNARSNIPIPIPKFLIRL